LGIQLHGNKHGFATALEVHYPAPLCDVIADTIALALRKCNITPAAPLSLNQTARAISRVQAGTAKVPLSCQNLASAICNCYQPLASAIASATQRPFFHQPLHKAAAEQCA